MSGGRRGGGCAGREAAPGCAPGLRRPVTAIPPLTGRTMALKAEGAALDCFEVTLKCEEGEDEEEAMVVAVIPRPEPMLRGEDGRGPHFRVTVRAQARPPPPQSGAPAPPPPPAWDLGAPSPSGLGPGRALAPPPPGFGIWGLPEFPLPRPRPGSGAFDPHPARSGSSGARAPPLPAPHRRPRSPAPRRHRQTQGPGCVLGRGAARPPGPRLGAAAWCPERSEDAACRKEDFSGSSTQKAFLSPNSPCIPGLPLA